MDYKAYALMAILLASAASVALVGTANAQALTVETDKTAYTTGDTIRVTGNVGTVQAGQPLLIRVVDPLGVLVRVDQVTVAADGSYTYSFPAGGLMRNSGVHTVTVSYRNNQETTTFDFTSTTTGPGWRTGSVNIEGTSHSFRYQITGGSLQGVTGDVDLATLTFAISSTAAGKLTLELPRALIQSLSQEGVPTGGSDVAFEAFVDGELGNAEDQTATAATNRVIAIDFEAGTEEIEVVGTWLVPEFGAIAAIILAVAIVGIIVATTRYSKFSSFLPRH